VRPQCDAAQRANGSIDITYIDVKDSWREQSTWFSGLGVRLMRILSEACDDELADASQWRGQTM
jgi:hypothetical protein